MQHAAAIPQTAQIAQQALRHLGLPLGDIAGLLSGEGAAPGRIIDKQLFALDQVQVLN